MLLRLYSCTNSLSCYCDFIPVILTLSCKRLQKIICWKFLLPMVTQLGLCISHRVVLVWISFSPSINKIITKKMHFVFTRVILFWYWNHLMIWNHLIIWNMQVWQKFEKNRRKCVRLQIVFHSTVCCKQANMDFCRTKSTWGSLGYRWKLPSRQLSTKKPTVSARESNLYSCDRSIKSFRVLLSGQYQSELRMIINLCSALLLPSVY